MSNPAHESLYGLVQERWLQGFVFAPNAWNPTPNNFASSASYVTMYNGKAVEAVQIDSGWPSVGSYTVGYTGRLTNPYWRQGEPHSFEVQIEENSEPQSLGRGDESLSPLELQRRFEWLARVITRANVLCGTTLSLYAQPYHCFYS